MDERERSVEENPSNQTGYEAAPMRPALPAFDEESIHRARPAVPLGEVSARRSWPLATVLMLLLAGVVGGAIALFVVTRYLRRPAFPASSPATATRTAAPPAATSDSSPDTEPVGDPAETSTAPASEQAQATEKTESAEARENEGSRARDDENASQERVTQENDESAEGERVATGETSESDSRRSLQGALDSWIASTNARDIDQQMQWYGRRVNAFYLTRNASRRDVRAEKAQLFGRADTVEVRAGEPEIKFGSDGKTATMRFRKDYTIAGGRQNRRGAVLQELRWRLTGNGWKIISERDLRVLR